MDYTTTETPIKRNKITVNASMGALSRPLDTIMLLEMCIERLKILREKERWRGNEGYPFMIDDILINVDCGSITIYYYYQYDENGNKIKEVWE